MESGVLGRYGYIEEALNETGLVVVENVKHGKKTIITVTRGQNNKTCNFLKKEKKENLACRLSVGTKDDCH